MQQNLQILTAQVRGGPIEVVEVVEDIDDFEQANNTAKVCWTPHPTQEHGVLAMMS